MKRCLLQLAFAVAILPLLAIEADAAPWRGIVPLKSSRSDVERLLGNPSSTKSRFYVIYSLKDEEVRIDYSDKNLCAKADAVFAECRTIRFCTWWFDPEMKYDLLP
jgi:hypothetical protein